MTVRNMMIINKTKLPLGANTTIPNKSIVNQFKWTLVKNAKCHYCDMQDWICRPGGNDTHDPKYLCCDKHRFKVQEMLNGKG